MRGATGRNFRLAIQATTAANLSARLAKAKSRPELTAWLKSAAFEVWGWGKQGRRWHVKRVALQAEDLEPVNIQPARRRRRADRQRLLFDG